MIKRILPILLGLILFCSVFVIAANCPPSLPKTYIGNVSYNGNLLLGDFSVRAKIGDDAVGMQDLVDGTYEVDVAPCSGTTGQIIFFINGVQAIQQGSYNGAEDWGKEIILDLTLNSMPSEGNLCGDSVIDLGEECDGINLAGRSTTDCGEGWTGIISCSSTCQIDYSNCDIVATSNPSSSSGSSSSSSRSSSDSKEGTIHIVSTSQINNGITKTLMNEDYVEFDILNKGSAEKHTITIDGIGINFVTLTIASNPVTIVLEEGESKKLDLIGDNFYDLYVELTNLVGNKADIYIKTIHEEIPSEEPPETIENKEESTEGITGAAIVDFTTSGKGIGLIIGILIILGFFILIRRRNKEGKKNVLKE